MGRTGLTNNQKGIVSIMVTMSLMIVVSLIVLAFAQIARREQRMALDDQLSTQAYYAAESGINAARAQMLSTGIIPNDTSCNGTNDNVLLSPASPGVKTTCVTINSAPSTLQATVGRRSKTLLLRPSTGALGVVEVRWFMADGATGALSSCPPGAAANRFTPGSTWSCPFDVLRFDLTNASSLNRNALLNNTKSGFAVPSNNLLGVVNPAEGTGIRTSGRCDGTGAGSYCVMRFNNLGSADHYLRLSTVYSDNVMVQVSRLGGGGFAGSQVQIDSTGKAQDVLRRVRASISLMSDSPLTESAITSGETICKRGELTNGRTNFVDNCAPNFVLPSAVLACSKQHDIVLVLDSSSSMQRVWEDGDPTTNPIRMDELVDVSSIFINTSGVGAAGNKVGIISFRGQPTVSHPLSANKTTLLQALKNIDRTQSGTQYLPALVAARNMLTTSPSGAGTPKVVIFISDGLPFDPEPPIIAMANSMKATGIQIYAISIIDTSTVPLMTKIASSPATAYYRVAEKRTDFRAFFNAISSTVRCP